MRVGLTYDLKESCVKGDCDDTFAEFDTRETVEAILTSLENCGYEVVPIGNVKHLLNQLPVLDVDIVFNIAEGLKGRCREAYVPALLEAYGIPYVGSGPSTLAIALDKLMTKRIVSSYGIPVPKVQHFPFIVKPRYEGSSKGIDKESVVSNPHQLQNRIEYVKRIYGQPALIEEFIEGWEFTVAIIGNNPPQALPPLQRSVDRKTTLASYVMDKSRCSVLGARGSGEFSEPLSINEGLEERLKTDAVTAYKVLGCRDFARADFRVDFNGQDYLLELNPLPSLAKDGSFAILAECLNSSYDDMLGKILIEALKRCIWYNKDGRRNSKKPICLSGL